MAQPLTYGGLVAEARRAAAVAAVGPLPAPGDGASWDAAELVGLVALVGRHARFLGQAAGPGNPALELAWQIEGVVEAARGGLPSGPVEPGGAWRAAIDLLGLGHDLLASQLGPEGQPQGPDAAAFAHRGAVAAATVPLASLVGLVADSAAERAGLLRRHLMDRARPSVDGRPTELLASDDPAVTLGTARALDVVAGLRPMVDLIVEECGRGDLPRVLDDVRPLYGDRVTHPFDHTLEQLRLAAHELTRPPARAHQAALVEFAGLAVAVGEWTGGLAGWARMRSRGEAGSAYAAVAARAPEVVAAWQAVHQRLGSLRSLGLDGRAAAAMAGQVRRQVETAGAAAARDSGVVDRRAALVTARRAVLVLPELAASSQAACQLLLAESQLRPAPSARPQSRIVRSGAELVRAYQRAERVSRDLVAACAALPGPQPLAGRAAYLADRSTPLVVATPQPPPDLARGPRSGKVSVRDPRGGVVTCEAARFEQALRHPGGELAAILRSHARRVTLFGDEHVIILAALVAKHAPDQLAAAGPPSSARPDGATTPPEPGLPDGRAAGPALDLDP
ncbi:hypothetical protein I6A60_19105 [Frankia sp. AgB1.9]|uniref:hypothetical protein n=1 Tax=unclassified Frankia TaxID=2632575 RepID=UPI001933240C|nr:MULTISPECIES: hypothetical protein [unclassified Frankia]MBL7487903.1 hypothetical protein [Frankia sp. AgW1.1]MBL7549969.1 hypothetical protein [Frankia sp. AgB1.9]MBL7621453.1 hypothetical protein [Frankia sp. AgB1.8]